MAMIADDALGSQNRAQRTLQSQSRISRERWQGRGCFHGFGVIGHQLPRQLRIGQKISEVIPTRTQTNNGVEGDWH
jgi:hypothetical protein